VAGVGVAQNQIIKSGRKVKDLSHIGGQSPKNYRKISGFTRKVKGLSHISGQSPKSFWKIIGRLVRKRFESSEPRLGAKNMRLKDLQTLPKVRDSFSYLYVEHCKVDRDEKAIAFHDKDGRTPVPCASLTLLLLGPGTSVTHAAIQTLADCGCLVMWTGEMGVRFYAQGMGETRAARNLLRQSFLCSIPSLRLKVVRRMYEMRFPEAIPPDLTLEQLRGREGVRVRDAYAKASRETGVPWSGRSYKRDNWNDADPINRALSSAHSCLYGIVHAAIVSAGYSTALGFIHTGKMLSFVYDIADLYKADITVPMAFRAAAESESDLERRVRKTCREGFYETKLLARIIPDIAKAMDVPIDEDEAIFDTDESAPGGLWDGHGVAEGGRNWGDPT
jgi:CRISP-associated protein Cas1